MPVSRMPDPHADRPAGLRSSGPGGLTPAQLEEVARHLAQCPLCQARQKAVTRLESVPPEALLNGPPDDAELLVRQVIRRLRAEEAARPATESTRVPRQHRPPHPARRPPERPQG